MKYFYFWITRTKECPHNFWLCYGINIGSERYRKEAYEEDIAIITENEKKYIKTKIGPAHDAHYGPCWYLKAKNNLILPCLLTNNIEIECIFSGYTDFELAEGYDHFLTKKNEIYFAVAQEKWFGSLSVSVSRRFFKKQVKTKLTAFSDNTDIKIECGQVYDPILRYPLGTLSE